MHTHVGACWCMQMLVRRQTWESAREAAVCFITVNSYALCRIVSPIPSSGVLLFFDSLVRRSTSF